MPLQGLAVTSSNTPLSISDNMKINYDKTLWISAAVFFVSMGLMYFAFNGTDFMLPLFIIAMISMAVLIWSSSSLMVSPLKDLEKSTRWKKLSKKEEWVILILILLSLGVMWYLEVRAFIAGPIVIAFSVWAIELYLKSKNK
jgi:uncharacterized membrane protein YhaH (DUF805 family)